MLSGTNENVINGLRPTHCYSLLEIKEINQLKFLKLRNPWGHEVWTGDYSKESKKWNN